MLTTGGITKGEKEIWKIFESYKDLMIYPPSALLEEEDEDYGSYGERT